MKLCRAGLRKSKSTVFETRSSESVNLCRLTFFRCTHRPPLLNCVQRQQGQQSQLLVSCRLGDQIRASGKLEHNQTTLLVYSIAVIRKWQTQHPGISFVPRSLPRLQPHQTSQTSGKQTRTQPPYCFTACWRHALSSTTLESASLPCMLIIAAASNFMLRVLPLCMVCCSGCLISAGSSTAQGEVPDKQLSGSQALCKQWINGGRCIKGDACQYRHVQPSKLPELRKGWVASRWALALHLLHPPPTPVCTVLDAEVVEGSSTASFPYVSYLHTVKALCAETHVV